MLAGSDVRPTDIGQWKADVRTRNEKELPVKEIRAQWEILRLVLVWWSQSSRPR